MKVDYPRPVDKRGYYTHAEDQSTGQPTRQNDNLVGDNKLWGNDSRIQANREDTRQAEFDWPNTTKRCVPLVYTDRKR